ncbi:MAG TPA: PAS domain-containing protein [Longimicrobium sp.]|nr:PAS domain-containing protein [Longimicrobium sp.]
MADTGAWPAGGGEAGELIRSRDWSQTPLGPIEGWPQSLRTAVDIMLGSPAPVSVMWGPELVQLYNDAYVPIAQERHPAIFGRPARENWPDALAFLEPIFDGVMAGGPAVVVQDRRVPLRRPDGGVEERAFRANFSPVPLASGAVGGIFHPLEETTPGVRAVEALRESEDRLLLTLAAAELGIWEHDLSTDLFHLDQRAQALYGLPPVAGVDELVGRVHPDDRARLAGEFQAAMDPAVRGPVSTEYRVVHANGTVHWLRVRGRVYFAGEGAGERPVRGLGTVQDVTDEKRANQALRENEDRLRLALDIAELGTWSWELATGVGEIDARGAEIVGIPAGVVPDIAQAQRASIHPDDLARVEADAAAGLQRDGAFDLAYRAVRPDGGVRHVASRARVVTDADGRPVRLVGTNRDVTAEREAEARLRASEEKYRTLFETIDEGFCVIELLLDEHGTPVDYRFVEANPVFASQTGLVGAVGRRALELVPELEPFWIRAYGRVALTGEPIRFENHAPSMGRWFDVNAFRVGEPRERRVAILFKDVTARKQAELERERLLAALKVERERLEEVIRRAPAFMVVLRGPNHVLELVNDAYQQLIGDRDVVGKPLFDAVPDARGQGYEELLDQVLATGEPFVGRGLPVRLERTPGAPSEERIIDFAYVPLTEADGTRSGIVVLGTDVTEQVRSRQMIEAARDRAERLQALTAALAGARTVSDVADVVVADMVVALGARTGALAGRTPDGDALVLLRTVGFPDPVESGVRRQPFDLRSPLIECYQTQSPVWLERRDGPEGLDARFPPIAPVWDVLGVASAAFIPLDTAGETVGVISFAWGAPRVFSDEERAFLLALGQQAALAVERARLFEAEHAARAQAEAAREQLGRVFQHAPACIATLRGPDHVFEIANPLYRRLVGNRELVGKPAREAVPELIGQGYIEPLDRVYQSGEPYAVNEARVLFEGTPGTPLDEYFFNFVYQPLTDAGGAVDGILAYGADVTAQVQARREIEAARAEAEAANRAKSEFLAVMSHELRTPLNAIGGYAELMEMGIRGPVTEQQRGDLHRIQQSQRHLLGLINEVLNYAKLESGAVHFDVEDICVRDALGAAAALVAPQAGTRGLVLDVLPCPPEMSVRADPDKLRQILLNLLSNAVKFTDRGGRVELACAADAARVRLTVRDSGIGIPADQLERIFEPFVQVRADLTRTAEGTGLGLAISRDLARGMGGDLTAESTPGTGSTFTLTLPRAREE